MNCADCLQLLARHPDFAIIETRNNNVGFGDAAPRRTHHGVNFALLE
jgi:hypothetical protein